MRRLREVIATSILAVLLTPALARADVARSADAFVNSIGVNVHLTYDDTAYGNFEKVHSRLLELGVRHVRDGLCGACRWQQDRLLALAADGIKADLIIGTPTNRTGTLAANLGAVKDRLLPSADAIEAPNEWDQFSGWAPDWSDQLRTYQARLWSAVQSDRQLRSLPVVGPSLVAAGSRTALGRQSPRLDYGNLHPYPGGRPPEAVVSGELASASLVSGAKDVMATESGYHNALSARTDHVPVPESVAAAYLPRMFLENFRRGIVRTYTYELVDEWAGRADRDPEASFGLVHADFSRKPAFTALRNLIGVLRDPGPAVDSSDVALSVRAGTPDVQRLVLRKRDGRVAVALWRSAALWDRDRRVPVTVTPTTVNVGFDRSVRRVWAFAPVRSEAAREVEVRNGVARVRVGGDPIVLEASVGAGAAARSRAARRRHARPRPRRPTRYDPAHARAPYGERRRPSARVGRSADLPAPRRPPPVRRADPR